MVKLILVFGLLVVVGAIAGIVIHFATAPDESPRELFVSAGHNGSTAVNISWVTESDSVASCAGIGPSSDSLITYYCGKKSSYTFNSYKFGLYTSPTIHVVTVDGLDPSTTYFYSVGDFDRGKTSDVFSFRTAPPPLQPTAFTVVGDLGQTINSRMTLQRMATFEEADAILHVGDMSYADTEQSSG